MARRGRDRLVRPLLQNQAAARIVLDSLVARVDGVSQLVQRDTARLDDLAQHADGHGARLDSLERQLGGLMQQFGGLSQQLGDLERRLNGLELRFDSLDRCSSDRHTRHSESILWLAENHPGAAASTVPTAPGRASDVTAAPRVSVIMATYNRRSLVAAAIESVLAQTYPHWELLIVDDGSTDGTCEIVNLYQSDRRIRYEVQHHLRRRGRSQPRTRR